MIDEINELIAHCHEFRKTANQSPEESELTDEEFAILVLAIRDEQKLINKCRYSIIQRMIEDGWLAEVWPPYNAHFGEPLIRPAWEVSEAHQSTNRI